MSRLLPASVFVFCVLMGTFTSVPLLCLDGYLCRCSSFLSWGLPVSAFVVCVLGGSCVFWRIPVSVFVFWGVQRASLIYRFLSRLCSLRNLAEKLFCVNFFVHPKPSQKLPEAGAVCVINLFYNKVKDRARK